MSLALNEIRSLTVTERLKLLGDIWETLVEEPEALPLSEVQAREIDRRLLDYRRQRDRGVSREELERRLDAE